MTDVLRVPALSDDENGILNLLVKQLDEKAEGNLERSSFYDGWKAVRQVGTTIPPQYMRLAIALGWNAKGVDGLARRCNLDRFFWTGGDLDALGMPELEESNFLLSELAQARTDSLIHGVSYLVTTRGVDGEPDVLVHAKDALNATGDWNTRRRALDSLLSVTSRKDNQITGFVLYLPNMTISAEKDSSGWSVDRSEHTFGVPADPLVYRPRGSRRMGRSRISRATMSHQMSALRALIRIEAHMDIYAIPKLILLGGDESAFTNPDGSPKPAWQVVMGRMFGLPDNEDGDPQNARGDVKQLSAESPQPHLAQINMLAKLIAREFDLPDSDFALTDMANPTNADSITEARGNLIAEAEGATDDWSVPIRRTVARALAMQNGLESVPDEWRSIAPKWRSPVFLSKAAAADAGAKQVGAVEWLKETRVGLELLGLDEQQIDRALDEKQAAERRTAGRAVLAALPPRGQVAAVQVTTDANAG